MKKLNKLWMPIIVGSVVGTSLPLAILTGCSCHNTPVDELEIDDNLVYKQNYGYVEMVDSTNGTCYLQGFYLSEGTRVEDLSIEVLNLKGIENPSIEVEIENIGYNYFNVNIYFKSSKALVGQYAEFDIKISNKNSKSKTFTGFQVYDFSKTLRIAASNMNHAIGTTSKNDTYDCVMPGTFIANLGSMNLLGEELKKIHVAIKTTDGKDVKDITPTILVDEDSLDPEFRIKLSFTNFQAQKNNYYNFVFTHEDLPNWRQIFNLELDFLRTEDKIYVCKYDETNLKATLQWCHCSDEEIVIPDEIEHNGKKYKITSVAPKSSGLSVFRYLSAQKIVFGDNITNIVYATDFRCKNLKTIHIGKNASFDNEGKNQAPFEALTIENIVINPENPYLRSNDANCIIKNTGDAQNPKFDYLLLAGNKVSSVPASITKIGYRAFQNNQSASFTIPKEITEIEPYAFILCTNLEQITFESQIQIKEIGISTFNHCIKLESITIPEGVEKIGTSAFSGCASLQSVVLPNTLKEFGLGCFNGCVSLTTVSELPASLETIPLNPFSGCISLEKIAVNESNPYYFSKKNGVDYNAICTSYSDYTLVITGLVSSTLPQNSILNANAFADCRTLTEIDLSNVIMVGNACFANCSNLVTVKNANNLLSIGDSSFAFCESLKEITLSSVYLLGHNAFHRCLSLTKADLSSASLLSSLGSSCFSDCTALTDVKLPENLETIKARAFAKCNNLKTIDIPDSVVTIEERVFVDCFNLTNINFGEDSALSAINTDTFLYCLSLKNITIPKNVKSINKQAFDTCIALTNVNFKDPNNWHYQDKTEIIDPTILSDPEQAATFLVWEIENNIVKG